MKVELTQDNWCFHVPHDVMFYACLARNRGAEIAAKGNRLFLNGVTEVDALRCVHVGWKRTLFPGRLVYYVKSRQESAEGGAES
jgi:hypothetical protein